MHDSLKKDVCDANLRLVAEGLVLHTFGNVSGISADRKVVAIKPSGVSYERMTPEQMVLLSLETGEVVEGDLRPSSDTATHLELYRAFDAVGGVVHTHSLYATAWAQACQDVPALGTTHADSYHGPIPCTRPLNAGEIADGYETATGRVIVERLGRNNPMHFPGVLVAQHGPFAWDGSPSGAVLNANILEYLARLATLTLSIRPDTPPIPRPLLDKHFFRKHGPGAYYGQGKS